MGKMSKIFDRAYGSASATEAIKLYDIEINSNPENFAAYNNRGLRKMELAKAQKNKTLLEDAKADFTLAIQICKKVEKAPYEGASGNLKKARSLKL